MSRNKRLENEFNCLLREESPEVVFEVAGYQEDMVQTELFCIDEFDFGIDDRYDFLDYELYRN